MPAKNRKGTNRQVVLLSDENYLAVHTAATLVGEQAPRFGMISKVINLVLDDWRTRQALKTTEVQP